MSQVTKRALAASLKKLLSRKPLEKITVVDIAEDCGVNRQTFYYHFQDIYDLIEWTYLNDGTKAIGGKKTYDTWQQGFLRIFAYVSENRDFVLNTYRNMECRVHLERYLYDEALELLLDVVKEQSEGVPIREDDCLFIANFYKYAFVGLVLEWIGTGMKERPERIVEKLSTLLHGDLTGAIQKFRTDSDKKA